jgi:hypothetical protein
MKRLSKVVGNTAAFFRRRLTRTNKNVENFRETMRRFKYGNNTTRKSALQNANLKLHDLYGKFKNEYISYIKDIDSLFSNPLIDGPIYGINQLNVYARGLKNTLTKIYRLHKANSKLQSGQHIEPRIQPLSIPTKPAWLHNDNEIESNYPMFNLASNNNSASANEAYTAALKKMINLVTVYQTSDTLAKCNDELKKAVITMREMWRYIYMNNIHIKPVFNHATRPNHPFRNLTQNPYNVYNV